VSNQVKHKNYLPFRVLHPLIFIIYFSCKNEDDVVKTTLTTIVYGVVKDCDREIPFQNYKGIIKERQPSRGA
jgi:hypothetical protein